MKNNSHERLYLMARALLQPDSSVTDALQSTLTLGASTLKADRAALVVLDEDCEIAQTYALSSEPRLWERLTAQNLINLALYTRRPVSVPDLSADERWQSDGWNGSAYCVPILYQDEPRGVYLLLAPTRDHFDAARLRFIGEMTALTAEALENGRKLAKLQATEAHTRRLYEKAQQDHVEHMRLEQMRRDLTAMVYHDLRGPLQNVGASLSGLERVLATDEQAVVDELLRVGSQSLRRLTRMVKSLLDIERLEEGRAIVARRSTKLHNLVSDALELVYPLAREAEQLLVLDLDANLPVVSVDADMILRVLTNLIENAIKHTPTGGKITVSAGITADAIRISVTDTGPGVPLHFHDEIFDKYFRIKYVNAPNGVGLGLAFCRLAVEAHGGAISVANGTSGGAVFSFTLPIEQQNVAVV
ncbi:MAG: GAF domain-containing protein [Anaerolineae bacterium]|nr:GAF domain-containing protein [Anaerolineae bacterium]